MTKSYEPVRVANPSEGHLLPLLPNQDFVLVLDDPNPEVEYNSKFFELSKTEFRKDSTVFSFTQKYNLDSWSRISRTYLGEVSVLTNSYFGSLCVFLETFNVQKSRLMTVINPFSNYVKVDPQSLLEVVVFDEKSQKENWGCTIISGDSGLKYEMFEYKKFDPFQTEIKWEEMNSFCFSYPRAMQICQPRSAGGEMVPFYEHHFWFRIDRSSISSIPHMSPGIYPAGKIILDSEDDIYRFLNLNVRVKNKSKLKLLDFRGTVFTPPTIRRRHMPKDSIFKQNIYLRKKSDTDLHSHRVIYV